MEINSNEDIKVTEAKSKKNRISNKTIGTIGSIAAIVIALLSVLAFTSNQLSFMSSQLTSRIIIIEDVQRTDRDLLISKLSNQSSRIAVLETKLDVVQESLNRIEDKLYE